MMIESLLLHLLIGLLIFAAVFAVIKIALPNLGAPPWVSQIAYIVVAVLFIVWIIYLLLPLVRSPAL